MLSITDLKTGAKLTYENDPYVVLSYSHSKMGRGGAVVKTKLKNLRTGGVIDKTFQGADKVEEASLSKKKSTFLYSDENSAYFMDEESYDQFDISLEKIGSNINYLAENTPVDIIYFNNEAINIELPIKMNFKVTSAPPGVRGNTAGSVTKKVTIETGALVDAPLFIKEGDSIVVDTRDGSYVERAN
ncbi:MAG: elongation factor P [Patescibacteria group bacterium]|jgi:elongation factor P